MSIVQLRKTTKKWQDLFGLSAWSIAVVYAKPEDMHAKSGDLVYGEIRYEPTQRVATIFVIHPRYSKLFQPPLQPPNSEETIVHELLHLVTDPIVKKAGSDAHEQFINLLTSILTKKNT
jgi:hypothetical protein